MRQLRPASSETHRLSAYSDQMSARTRKAVKERKRRQALDNAYTSLLGLFHTHHMILDLWTPKEFVEFYHLCKRLPHRDGAFRLFLEQIQDDSVPFCLDDISDRFKEFLTNERFVRKCRNGLFITQNVEWFISCRPNLLMELAYFCRMQPSFTYLTHVINLMNHIHQNDYLIRYQEVKDAMNLVKIQKVMEL